MAGTVNFTGVKVFSTTLARNCEQMGETITKWLKDNTATLEIVDKVVTSPFAVWIVSRRTASAPSSSETASRPRAPAASCSATNRMNPSMSGPRSSSYDRARRASLRRFA